MVLSLCAFAPWREISVSFSIKQAVLWPAAALIWNYTLRFRVLGPGTERIGERAMGGRGECLSPHLRFTHSPVLSVEFAFWCDYDNVY